MKVIKARSANGMCSGLTDKYIVTDKICAINVWGSDDNISVSLDDGEWYQLDIGIDELMTLINGGRDE